MKIYKCTSSQHNWYVTDRKPTICPCCGKREVRPSIFGMPTEEVFKSGKWHIAGCMPDFLNIGLGSVKIVMPLFGKIQQEIKLHFEVQ